MQDKELLSQIKETIVNFNLPGFKKKLATLISNVGVQVACEKLAEILYHNYTRYKADAQATFLEAAIKLDAKIALVNHPENSLFKLTILRGSKDLYDCYMEEAVIPYLKINKSTEPDLFYGELLDTAETISASFLPKYVECIKGMDYNGAFGIYNEDENVVVIHKEDYETLEDVAEKYNTIIGRRIIIDDLNIKFSS